MKGLKRKLFLSVVVLLSIFAFAVNSWAVTDLPHAFFNGLMVTYLDNPDPAGDDLIFVSATINSVFYSDGTSSTTDVVVGKDVTIVGAQRNCPTTPCTSFTDATISISDGVVTYFSATLTDITFTTDGVQWFLNPGLDVNNAETLNLTNILLNANGSVYIQDLIDSLGSATLAGMQMRLFNIVGDLTGDSTNVIVEGLIDGVQSNSPPVADAGATTADVSCLATSCEITLDGSQSSDADSTPGTNDDIEFFEWYDENSVLLATGETVVVTLPLGMHDITLKVTDFAGASGEYTITIVIDPAELSFLEIKKAMVKWNDGEIKIKGRLALPAGVSYENVNSVGSAAISLSSLGAVVDESVDFDLLGNDTKWKYSANPVLGIHKFKIDWNGAKFDCQKDYFTIESHHFGVDTTTLEIELASFSGPLTIAVGDVIISIDENDVVTVTPDTVEVDVDYNDYTTEIEVVLPFALATTDIIEFNGTINDSVTVGDYYTAAVGKFKIKAKFDTTGIDPTTLDPSLTLDIALGDEGFRGILFIAPADWTKITDNKWKYKLK